MFDLSLREEKIFKKLSTPEKIQDFLDSLPFNYEVGGETLRSPRGVLNMHTAHCMEGALLAAAALWYHGEKPLILDLRTLDSDSDHVVTLFQRNGYWGAMSKTNHNVLRFRDPIYRTIRELVFSYFHEYFLVKNGVKTLREYSLPFSLKQFGTEWITQEEHLWEISDALDRSRHFPFVSKKNERFLRRASRVEREAGSIPEWPEPKKRN